MLMYLSRYNLQESGGSSNTSRSFVVSEASSKCAKIELASDTLETGKVAKPITLRNGLSVATGQ
jgi:hypothetical protein